MVTGVQTCALPILALRFLDYLQARGVDRIHGQVEEAEGGGPWRQMVNSYGDHLGSYELLEHFAEKPRSVERRVGKECRSQWWPDH